MYANVCYNSSYQVEKPHSLKNLLELYLITIGLEIDSAKSGDKPPLPDTTVVDEMLKKAGLEKPKESEAAAFIRYKDGFKEYRGNVNKYQYKDIFNGLSNKEMIEQYLSKGSNSNLTILPYIFHLLIPEMVRTEINRFESEYDIFIGMIKNYTAKYQQSDTTHSLFKFDKDDKYFKTFEKSGTKDINKLRNLLTLVDAYKDVRLKLDQYEYVIQDKFDQNSLKKDRGIIDEYIGSILFIQYGHKHYNDIADIGAYLSTLDVEQLKDLLNQIVRLNWSFLEYVSQETKDKILKEALIGVEGETAKKMYDLLSNFKFKGSRLFYLFLLKAKRLKTFKEYSSEYDGEKIEKLTRNLMRALEDFTFEEAETIARDIFDFYQTLASNIYTNFPNVNTLLDDEQLKKRFLSFSDSLSAYFKERYDSGDISLNENASFCEINQKFALLVGNDSDSSTYLETIISQSSLENVFEEHTGVKLDFTTQDYVPVKDALRELMKAAFSYSEPPEDIRDRFVRSDLTIKREYFVKFKRILAKAFENVKEKTSVKPLIVELNHLMYGLINDLFSDSKEEALEYFYYLTRKSSHSNIVKQKYLFDLMFQDLYNYMVCGGSAHD